MQLKLLEDAIYKVTNLEHIVTSFLSGNEDKDIECEITLDEMCEDTIGFDLSFKDFDTKEEVMSMGINIPVKET